jgi:predicted ester cyclase
LGLAATALVVTIACSGAEPPPPPPPPAPPVLSAEARVQRYQDCWGYFNTKAWDQFQTCYTDAATSEDIDSGRPILRGRPAIIEAAKAQAVPFSDRRGELQLVLSHGPHIVGVALWHGTNDGAMPGPDGKPMPATNKKVGLPTAHLAEFDATGSSVVRDASYFEEGTMMAQLGLSKAPARAAMAPSGAPVKVVIAKNDATEAANVAAMQAMMAASNAHDIKAMTAGMADGYKMIEIGRPADMDAKAALASTKEMLSAFPDVKFTNLNVWAAGDYVVATGNFEGTNTGDIKSMGVKKTGKAVKSQFLEICRFENGKIKEDWLFYNGAAFAAQLGLK